MRLAVIFFLLAGLVANIVSWHSVEPVVIGLVFYAIGLGLVFFLPAPRDSLRFFSITYSIYWATTGVSSLYLNYGNDISLKFGDAQNFFLFATGAAGTFPLKEIYDISEGAIAIKIWHYVYEVASTLGLSVEPYIGSTVNAFILALVSVLSLHILRKTSPRNPNSERLLLLLFAFCPMFWLSASIHLRESFTILFLAINYYVLIQFMSRKSNLFWLGAAVAVSVVFPFVLHFLRTEFFFIPIGLFAAAIVSMMVFQGEKRVGGNLKYVLLLLLTLLVVQAADNLGFIFSDKISEGREDYAVKALATGVEGSLGYKFVVDQPLYIRAVVGLPYLFLMPIPLWAGIDSGSASIFFKALFAIFNFFFLPYLAIAAGGFLRLSGQQRVRVYFLLGSSAVLTVAVAISSLESRHIIPFLPPLFIACAAMAEYVMARPKGLRVFTQILMLTMFMAHVAWLLIKV